jgi:hypothetical protein
MPRESIRERNGDKQIIVGWQRDAGVQVGVINNASGVATVTCSIGGETTSVRDVPVPLPDSNGWFADLDRKGLNDLIRLLRRARDAAFGRDE